MKFGQKKLEMSVYLAAQNAFRYLEPFRRGSRITSVTDRRTDGQTRGGVADRTGVTNSAVLTTRAKNVNG